MNFFVAAESVWNGSAVSGEGRRIENDQVVARDDLFVWAGSRLGFEPIEDIRCFERTAFGDAVNLGIFRRGRDSLGTLVQSMHAGGAGFGSVEGEAANEAEG